MSGKENAKRKKRLTKAILDNVMLEIGCKNRQGAVAQPAQLTVIRKLSGELQSACVDLASKGSR